MLNLLKCINNRFIYTALRLSHSTSQSTIENSSYPRNGRNGRILIGWFSYVLCVMQKSVFTALRLKFCYVMAFRYWFIRVYDPPRRASCRLSRSDTKLTMACNISGNERSHRVLLLSSFRSHVYDLAQRTRDWCFLICIYTMWL